jgi:hypothetical protein
MQGSENNQLPKITLGTYPEILEEFTFCVPATKMRSSMIFRWVLGHTLSFSQKKMR